MKNVSHYRIALLCVISALAFNMAYSQGNETKDNFEKSFKVSENEKLVLKMYDSDLKVNTWNSNEVKLCGEIIIKDGKKEDVEKLLNAFKNPEQNQGNGKLEINTQFSEGTTIVMGFYKKTRLSSGESVSVGTFKASYTIWIPENIALNLISKYNSISAPSLKGKLDFQLYDVTLEMGDFGDKSTFDAKYSTVTLGCGNEARFSLYDSKFNTGAINKVIISSKYSKFNCVSISLLAVESYDDDFVIENLGGVDFDAKYSSLKAKGNSNVGKFKLYDCNIEAGNFGKLDFDSKYSELTAGAVGELNISSSYEDQVKITEVKTLSCLDGKYNEFSIGTVLNAINLPNSYETKLKVGRLAPDFISFKGDFKYGSVLLKVDPTVNYKLSFQSKYGSVNFPKQKFGEKTTYIKSNEDVTFEGSTGINPRCEISFKTYDTQIIIE